MVEHASSLPCDPRAAGPFTFVTDLKALGFGLFVTSRASLMLLVASCWSLTSTSTASADLVVSEYLEARPWLALAYSWSAWIGWGAIILVVGMRAFRKPISPRKAKQ